MTRQTPCIRPAARGFTLVELLIAMVIVGIFLGAVFGTFIHFLGTSGEQAALSSRSFEARTGLVQVRRDLASAGFGLPEGGLNNAVAGTPTSITIRSTAMTGRTDGTGQEAGQVGILQSGETVNGVPAGTNGVVLAPSREYITEGQLGSMGVSLKTTKIFFVTRLNPDYYERQYQLSAACNGTGCGDCAQGTPDLQYQDTNGGATPQPAVECVQDLQVRFGFQTSAGGLAFSNPGNLPAGADDTLPDVLKVGMVVQVGSKHRGQTVTSSPINYQDSDLQVTGGVGLNSQQQQYRWQVVEWTVPLPNIP